MSIDDYLRMDDRKEDMFEYEGDGEPLPVLSFPCCCCRMKDDPPGKCKPCSHYAD